MKPCGTSQVGVVIPVHNRAQTLIETLSYVIAQSVPPARLVIVDDGSTDLTADEVDGWLSEQALSFDWEVVRRPKESPSAARNCGFDRIKELPFVAFLDSDDHWPSDFLERCTSRLESDPGLVAISCLRHYNIHTNERVEDTNGAGIQENPIRWMFEFGGGITSCSVFRTTVIEKAGGWPNFLHSEDTELFCLVALEGQWALDQGQPVVFNIGNGLVKGEESNLSRGEELHMVWAERLEEIYSKIANRIPRGDRKPLHLLMSTLWYRAGRHQFGLENPENALHCYKRAVYWNWFHFKALKRWIRLRSDPASCAG